MAERQLTEKVFDFLGRGNRVMKLKSEDLPVMTTVDHEDLVNAEM